MVKHFFLLFFISLLFISVPEIYILPLTNSFTGFFSSLFASSSYHPDPPPDEAWAAWTQTSEKELHEVIDYSARVIGEKYASIVAQVTFQTATPWTHVLWIDKGTKTQDLPFQLKKNAPVLVGNTLVGILDFVGNHTSRVRLLSDPSIHPAVRVVRGGYMTRQALFMAQELQKTLQKEPSLMPNEQLTKKLFTLLDIFSENVQQEVDTRLAKGELQGSESSETPFLLRGVGFNLEYGDEESPQRDLRTGQHNDKDHPLHIIQQGDILETSGLDGFFPKGLQVAVVTKVFPLEEGAISYNVLAKSLAQEPFSPEYVTIIPALSEEPFSPPTQEDKILDLIGVYK